MNGNFKENLEAKIKAAVISIVIVFVSIMILFGIDMLIGPYILGRYYSTANSAYNDDKCYDLIYGYIESTGDIDTVHMKKYAVYISHAKASGGEDDLLLFCLMKVRNGRYNFINLYEYQLQKREDCLKSTDFLSFDTGEGIIYFTLVYKSVYDSNEMLKSDKYSTQDIYDSVLDEDLVFVYYYGKTE